MGQSRADLDNLARVNKWWRQSETHHKSTVELHIYAKRSTEVFLTCWFKKHSEQIPDAAQAKDFIATRSGVRHE